MRKVLELGVGAISGCLRLFVLKHRISSDASTFRYVSPGPPCTERHVQTSPELRRTGANCQRGQDGQTLEGQRLAHLILISWNEKAQVSHLVPAVKTNSPFYFNLYQNTGAWSKAKRTQLLHSKGISSTAGPHPKRCGEGPLTRGEKIIRRNDVALTSWRTAFWK